MTSLVYGVLVSTYQRGTDSGTSLHFPMWIHRAIIVTGLIILISELAIQLTAAIISIWKPDDANVRYVLSDHIKPPQATLEKKAGG